MITPRIRQMTLVLLCLASACGKNEKEKNPHGTLPQSGDMGANPNSGRMPEREGSTAPNTTPTTPMPNRVKTALFFQPNNFSPLETCIQTQLMQQSPDKIASGTVRGPISLTTDANGRKTTARARFVGKDGAEQDQNYTLIFRTPDPRGWTKQIRNLYVGAYGYGMDSKVDVVNDATNSVLFVLDIAPCESGE